MAAPKLVYLEWADAHTNAGWFTQKEIDEWKHHDWMIRECGFVVVETKEYIIFATGWKPADKWTNEQFVNLHRIPRTWIRKRQNIRLRGRR